MVLIFGITVLGDPTIICSPFSAFHDFFLGPQATAVGRMAPGSPEALRFRRQASWMGRVNLLLARLPLLLSPCC